MNRLRPAMRRILPLPVVYCLLSVANCQFSIAQSPPPSFDSLFRRASSFNANWDTVRVYPHLEAGVMGVAGELPPLDTMVFHPPAVGRVLSGYGRRGGRSHHGTDIKVDLGQPIYAAWDGIVRLSRWNRAGFGNLVVVRHANGVETYYAHLSARSVRANEIVEAGQEIGLGGRTGRASGLHLHFEMRYRDHSYDPERYIDFVSGTLRGARPVSPRDELRRRLAFAARAEALSSAARGDTVVLVPRLLADDVEQGVAPGGAMAGVGNVAGPTGGTGEKREGIQAARLSETAGGGGMAEDVTGSMAGEVVHVVRSGDTLWSLARRHGTTVRAICDLNNISPNSTLRIGRRLVIKN